MIKITSDYQTTLELIGTGDGSTTTFTLAFSQVISGSETIYVDGTEVARSEYTVNQQTGNLICPSCRGVVSTEHL